MWAGDVVGEWRTRGFVVLPGFLSAEDLSPALGELAMMFPTPQGFHDGTDDRRSRYVEDEFDGIDAFPFASTEFSMLAVHPRIVDLAELLLGQSAADHGLFERVRVRLLDRLPTCDCHQLRHGPSTQVPRRTTRNSTATT